MTLTPYEIGQVIAATAFGFAEPRTEKSFTEFLDVAIAVALAESGGDPTARHKNSDGSTDNGLWQINSVHREEFRHFGSGTVAGVPQKGTDIWPDRFEPTNNTVMAKAVYRNAGGSFSPWTGTYGAPVGSAGHNRYLKNRGHGEDVHKRLLADKSNGIEQALGGGTVFALATLADPTTDKLNRKLVDAVANPIDAAIGKVMSFLKEAGITVGVFGLGMLFLVLGVVFIATQTKAGKTVIDKVP